jgi:hypothetical protein
VDSQQQIWIGFSKSLTTNIVQSSNLGFGNGDRRKRSPTCIEESGDRTTHNNNKSQVRCPRLPFTLWIYEEKKSKVPYRNQIASNPRLGKALES